MDFSQNLFTKEFLLSGNRLPDCCNLLPEAKWIWKSFQMNLQRSNWFQKICNRLQCFGNRLLVPLNVEIQIQMWRVTSFYFIQKQSLVIDYQISVIDYTKLLCERMWLFIFKFEFQRSRTLVIDYQNIVIDYSLLKIFGTL